MRSLVVMASWNRYRAWPPHNHLDTSVELQFSWTISQPKLESTGTFRVKTRNYLVEPFSNLNLDRAVGRCLLVTTCYCFSARRRKVKLLVKTVHSLWFLVYNRLVIRSVPANKNPEIDCSNLIWPDHSKECVLHFRWKVSEMPKMSKKRFDNKRQIGYKTLFSRSRQAGGLP